ncbi:MAG: hypothetical protein JSV36_16460 [Anaerolineae bacterium]|nr:MAG: hypothetical protein JSV36_16460 [Anaerolineae bacterium]
MNETRFLILFRSDEGERYARLVIESLRSFGGQLSHCPVWVFLPDPARLSHALPGMEGVEHIPLLVKEAYRHYPFVEKVAACALAEEMAGPEIRSLVWLSLDCLIVNPPVLFDLGPSFDAAFRPVHHRNIGSPAHEPPDDFWQGVYRALEVGEMPYTVESFVDGQTLRPYFNTHCFAFNPAVGLGRAWWAHLKAMVTDEAFQAGPCRDEPHQIFLHQAILSTLVPKMLKWERVRPLPPEYNYPLNLLNEMPPDRRAPTLNSLVNAVYEFTFPWTEIEVREPLRSWLIERLSTESGSS